MAKLPYLPAWRTSPADVVPFPKENVWPEDCSKPNTSSTNRHMMPVRREPKGKRPHSLAANIRAWQQNAGKW